MIDCEIKPREKVTTGLTMELSPCDANNGEMIESKSIFVSEAAFGFLEPSVEKYCSEYGTYAHWGTTRVSSEEWGFILEDWRLLAEELEHAVKPEEFTRAHFVVLDVKRDFQKDFNSSKKALGLFINQLSAWIKQALEYCTVIVITGI